MTTTLTSTTSQVGKGGLQCCALKVVLGTLNCPIYLFPGVGQNGQLWAEMAEGTQSLATSQRPKERKAKKSKRKQIGNEKKFLRTITTNRGRNQQYYCGAKDKQGMKLKTFTISGMEKGMNAFLGNKNLYFRQTADLSIFHSFAFSLSLSFSLSPSLSPSRFLDSFYFNLKLHLLQPAHTPLLFNQF